MKRNATPCTTCGHNLNADIATDGGPTKPRSGDVTLCIRCGTAYEYVVGPPLVILRQLDAKARRRLPRELRRGLLAAEKRILGRYRAGRS